MGRSGSKLNSFLAVVTVALAQFSAAGAQTTRINFHPVDKDVVLARFPEVPHQNLQHQERGKTPFSEAGCSGTVSEQRVKYSNDSNVICQLPGETPEVMIVGAHFDKVERGTGAIDNWSGASLLSSLYQSLSNTKGRPTLFFVAFCEEESDLMGSDYYASHMTKEEVSRTDARVNLDSLGLSPAKVWVHRADKNLVAALAAVSRALNLPASEVDVERVGSADSEFFAIHSLTQQTFPILHSNADTLKQVHPDEYYDTYRLISGYLAYLGDLRRERPANEPFGK